MYVIKKEVVINVPEHYKKKSAVLLDGVFPGSLRAWRRAQGAGCMAKPEKRIPKDIPYLLLFITRDQPAGSGLIKSLTLNPVMD